MGHSSKLLNPHFIPYAYGTRAGITVIDLDQTLPMLRRAAAVLRDIVANDGTVIFVGTREDIAPATRKAALRLSSNAYYVNQKWFPGMLTNRIQFHGKDLIRDLRIIPDCVVFLNPIPNLHAIRECAIENVPTIGVIDSNVDPRIVMYPIPANDESTRTIELIAGVLSIAAREGLAINNQNQESQITGAVQRAHDVSREWGMENDEVSVDEEADVGVSDPEDGFSYELQTSNALEFKDEGVDIDGIRYNEEVMEMKESAMSSVQQHQTEALDSMVKQREEREMETAGDEKGSTDHSKP
jgi:small subunit ribosomal protein S2